MIGETLNRTAMKPNIQSNGERDKDIEVVHSINLRGKFLQGNQIKFQDVVEGTLLKDGHEPD